MHLLVFAYCFFSQCVITVLIAATLAACSGSQRASANVVYKHCRACNPSLRCSSKAHAMCCHCNQTHIKRNACAMPRFWWSGLTVPVER